MEVEFSTSSCDFEVNQDRSVLITSNDGIKLMSHDGAWRFQKIPLAEAAKLLAFLEHGMASGIQHGGRPNDGRELIINAQGDLSIWKFERWLISQFMNSFGNRMGSDADDSRLCDFLRSQETYGLVRFLLDEGMSKHPISALSHRYGVSESHFRRLCRRALGKGVKRELRQWRAATAVLDVVMGKQSMTDVAMTHGFASSSHFSREIKDLFGVSPCQFRRKS